MTCFQALRTLSVELFTTPGDDFFFQVLDGSHLAELSPLQTQSYRRCKAFTRTCQGHFVKSARDAGPKANSADVTTDAAIHHSLLYGQ